MAKSTDERVNAQHDVSTGATLWTEMDERGFAVVPDIVGPDEVSDLRRAVDDALETDRRRYEGRPGKEDFIALDLAHYGGPFLKLLDNEILDVLFGQVLGSKWILYSYTSTVMRPGSDQYTALIHTDMARQSGNYPLGVLLTLALDDFTPENGATWYLPGSHLTHRDRPDEEEFYANSVRVTRRAGDGVFFNPRVWHAGGANTTNQVRSGLTIYGVRSFMKQRFDFPRMIDPAHLEGQSERVLRILGFDTRVPTSMDQFYVCPEQRLYKGGQG